MTWGRICAWYFRRAGILPEQVMRMPLTAVFRLIIDSDPEAANEESRIKPREGRKTLRGEELEVALRNQPQG